jgi:hypothetical protein
MRSQINRWLIGRNVPEDTSESEMGRLKSEITSFKNQEDRYNQAYGAGAFTVEQLRQYTLPLREKVSALEARFARLKEVQRESEPVSLPAEDEIKTFAKESNRTLRKLDFDGQKVIVGKVVDRVIGTRQKLQIYGFIPVNIKKHVELCPSDRDGGDTIRHGVSLEPPKFRSISSWTQTFPTTESLINKGPFSDYELFVFLTNLTKIKKCAEMNMQCRAILGLGFLVKICRIRQNPVSYRTCVFGLVSPLNLPVHIHGFITQLSAHTSQTPHAFTGGSGVSAGLHRRRPEQ